MTTLSMTLFILLSRIYAREYHLNSTHKQSWMDAKIYCDQNYHGLATIITQQDFDNAVNEISVPMGVWIGLNDINQEGSWEWAGNSQCESGTGNDCTNFWVSGEPNNAKQGTEHCATFCCDLAGFNDLQCSTILAVLCNKNTLNPTNNPTTSTPTSTPTLQPSPASNVFLTQTYGGDGGVQFSSLNQGRINSISEWGLRKSAYPMIKNWTADEQTETYPIGVQNIDKYCLPIHLLINDYITGYRVYYSNSYVHGLIFYTRQNNEYSCFNSSKIENRNDSGIVSYMYDQDNFYYLTGWTGGYGYIIDRIQFQFTKYVTTYPTKLWYSSNQNYILVDIASNGSDKADEYCLSHFGTHLASVHSQQENDELTEVCMLSEIPISTWRCHFGLIDKQNEGHYVYRDGTTTQNYTNWYHDQPSNTIVSDCGFLNRYGAWGDIDCHSQYTEYPFICNALKITDNPTVHPTSVPTLNPTASNMNYMGGKLCDNLQQNIEIHYGGTLIQCVTHCEQFNENCTMINYFYYFKSHNDSRCYIFEELCDIKADTNNDNQSV
eukprot:485963_1